MKTVSLEQELNPWEAQAARFDFAAQKLNLDEGLWKILRYPQREIIVHIPVAMDDGRIEVFTGFRVQHSIARGPAKGGVRYSPDVTLDEAAPGQLDDVEMRRGRHSFRRSQGLHYRETPRSSRFPNWRSSPAATLRNSSNYWVLQKTFLRQT